MVLRFENVLNVTSWREADKPPKVEIHMEYIVCGGLEVML